MVPYAAAGPLSAMVPPIRMLFGVTPTSLAVRLAAGAVVGFAAAAGAVVGAAAGAVIGAAAGAVVGLAAGAAVGAAAGAAVGAAGVGAPLVQATSTRPRAA